MRQYELVVKIKDECGSNYEFYLQDVLLELKSWIPITDRSELSIFDV
jgi:hypothetical protein